jgi:hypothetical protein
LQEIKDILRNAPAIRARKVQEEAEEIGRQQQQQQQQERARQQKAAALQSTQQEEAERKRETTAAEAATAVALLLAEAEEKAASIVAAAEEAAAQVAAAAAESEAARQASIPVPPTPSYVSLSLTAALVPPSDSSSATASTLAAQYEIFEDLVIGAGNNKVFRGKDLRTGGPVVVKRVVDGAMPYVENRVMKEIVKHRDLTHPGLSPLRDHYLLEGDGFKDMCIVFDYNPSVSLFDECVHRFRWNMSNGTASLSPPEVVQAYCELLSVLDYVHAKGVDHRDIIWLKDDGRLQLIDFGSAVHRSATSKCSIRSLGATFKYQSPEMCRYSGERSKMEPDNKTDIWSLGATMLNLATGAYILLNAKEGGGPQHEHHLDCFEDAERATAWSFTTDFVDGQLRQVEGEAAALQAWTCLPDELRAVIARCLTADLAQRPSANELLQDPNTRLLKVFNSDQCRSNGGSWKPQKPSV